MLHIYIKPRLEAVIETITPRTELTKPMGKSYKLVIKFISHMSG